MIITEIFEKHGDPTIVWESAMNKNATAASFYLYELHELFNFWEDGVWIFNSPNEFRDFTYALELFDYVYFEDWDDLSDEDDYSALHQRLLERKNQEWTFDDCKRFVAQFPVGSIELVDFGRVSDLLSFSEDAFEKCKNIYLTTDRLEDEHLHQAEYKIMHQYSNKSSVAPGKSSTHFLEFLSNWGL
jgi:hypothetical protein